MSHVPNALLKSQPSPLHHFARNLPDRRWRSLDLTVSELYHSANSSFQSEWSSMSDVGNLSGSLRRKVYFDPDAWAVASQMQEEFPTITQSQILRSKQDLTPADQALLKMCRAIIQNMRKQPQIQTAVEARSWIKENQFEELSFAYLHLTVLPPEIGRFTLLTSLSFEYNDLKTLPTEFTHLRELTLLDLGHNQFSEFPWEIALLKKLKRLYFNHNQLIFLINNFGLCFPHLELLHLNDNQIGMLPDSIGHLTHLKDLDLSQNKLVSLPPSFKLLTGLEELNLCNNQLKWLPERFSCLTHLDEPMSLSK
jgi:Leucine-rich repeat (LRR) protein